MSGPYNNLITGLSDNQTELIERYKSVVENMYIWKLTQGVSRPEFGFSLKAHVTTTLSYEYLKWLILLIGEQLVELCWFIVDFVLSLNAWWKVDYLHMGGQQGKDLANGSGKKKSGDKKKTNHNLKKGE